MGKAGGEVKFPSTLLPQTNEPLEIQKGMLDLLAKINQLGETGNGIKSVTSNYTLTASDGVTNLFVTTGANSVTVTLGKSSLNKDRIVKVWKTDSGAGEVKIVGNTTAGTAETVNGYSAIYVGLQYQHADIYQDGTTNWNIGQYIAPVASEPSLGTPHPHYYQFSAALYNQAATTANTWYTVTIAGLTAGVKAIFIVGYCTSAAAAGADVVWRPYGSADTRVQSSCRSIARVPSAGGVCYIGRPVVVDSSGRFEVSCDSNNVQIVIQGYDLYWC
jgi:hypothetical protein